MVPIFTGVYTALGPVVFAYLPKPVEISKKKNYKFWICADQNIWFRFDPTTNLFG